MPKDTKLYDILGVSTLSPAGEDCLLMDITGITNCYRSRVEEGIQGRGSEASPR
jgi:hypothetical protein